MSESGAAVNDAPRIRTNIQALNRPSAAAQETTPAIEIKDANLFYGKSQALHDITMDINAKQVTAFIGPSGCGKSTLLRCLKWMNDLIDNVRITGTFRANGLDLYADGTDVIDARRSNRHGVPEVQPAAEVDLRDRRVRTTRCRHPRSHGPR